MISNRNYFGYYLISMLLIITNIFGQTSSTKNCSLTALSAFVKAYGYTRYFYPDKSLNAINWDFFLQSHFNEFRNSESNNETIEKLNKTIKEIAPLISFSADSNFENAIRPNNKYVFIKQHIGFGDGYLKTSRKLFTYLLNKIFIPSKTEIDKLVYKHLDSELTQKDGFCFYKIAEGIYIQIPRFLFVDETKKYKKRNYINDNKKSFSCFTDIAITWNIFRHFYPYFSDERSKLFDQNLCQYISKSLEANDVKEKEKALKSISSFLKDGHSNVASPIDIGLKYTPNFGICLMNDKIYVNRISTELEDRIKMEDEIIRIDGKNTRQIIDSLLEFNSIPDIGVLKNRIRLSLFGEKNSKISLQILRKNQVIDVDLIRDQRIYLKNIKESPPFIILPNNIAYINVNTCKQKDIAKNLNKIQHAKGLIVDLRGYPNYLSTSFLNRFSTVTVTDTIYFDYPVYKRPNGLFELPVKPYISKIKAAPARKQLNNNVIFLSNSRSISKTETWLDQIKHYKLGLIVGQATAGTNGDMTEFTLKDGFEIRFTGAIAYKHDKRPFMNNPILPDITIPDSAQSSIYGKDIILEAAIKIINNSNGN